MNTIYKKIILLCMIIWMIMAVIWLLISYYNQKTIEKYNEILQKYLLMNQITQLSESSKTTLNQYTVDPSERHLNEYLYTIRDMRLMKQQLYSLENINNYITLINYENMIDSQIEEMELAVSQVQSKRIELAASHFDEVTKISKYISESTLSLLSRELITYNEFYRKVIQQSNDLKKLGFWMLAMASCILLFFSYRIATSITRPILALTMAAQDISRGNFDKNIEIYTNDEISFLARTLNRMRINLKNLILEMQNKAQVELDLQEHKLLLKESELKMLQSQINPHFLFNTLNTLSKKAYLEGASETSDLISSVSELLRYNLRKLDVSVTLNDEIRRLEEYLRIQKARFMERVQYTLHIDEACLNFKIPSLTLQPFVENAFIHAIEPSEDGGNITIHVKDQEEHVVIKIEDNGGGMSKERMQFILSGESSEIPDKPKDHSTGIGIHNVIRRLQLFYGIQDVMEITAVPGEGTCVKLLLPKESGGKTC